MAGPLSTNPMNQINNDIGNSFDATTITSLAGQNVEGQLAPNTNPPAGSNTNNERNLGYIDGYAPFIPVGPGSALLNQTINSKDGYIRTATMPTDSESNFKYNLQSSSPDLYEDPLFPYFVMFIDENSPLLNSVDDWLHRYGEKGKIIEIKNRTLIYSNFYEQLKTFFYIGSNYASAFKDSKNADSGFKNFYIESITGFDKLTDKIPKYKEDKITITLTEDVAMNAQTLAWLYNNLAYSYKTKREVIPENLLRFNLNIMVRDMRNFVDEYFQFSDVSYYIYTLHDCNFNFFKSSNLQTELNSAGYGAINLQPMFLSFDVHYKSIERTLLPYLALNMYNGDDLYSIEDSQNILLNPIKNATKLGNIASLPPDLSDDATTANLVIDNNQSHTIAVPGTQTLGSKGNILSNFVSGVAGGVMSAADQFAKGLENSLENKLINIRTKLISDIIYSIEKIKPSDIIYPNNVYAADFENKFLSAFETPGPGQLLKQFGNNVLGTLESSIIGAGQSTTDSMNEGKSAFNNYTGI